MDTLPREDLGKLLAYFDAGVLVAQAVDGVLHAHPVALGRVQVDNSVCLAGGIDGTPVLEPEHRDACMLVCERRRKHLVLSGGVTLDFDPAHAHIEWVDRWAAWFPDGPTSLSLVLARFSPRVGEYWDHSGLARARNMVEAARSLVRKASAPLPREEHLRIL